MEASDLFVKFVYDDSVLSARLEESEDKLKEHDDLIKELLNKLGDLPTNTQLEFMRDSMEKDFEKKINEMNNKYQNLLNQYNSLNGQFKNFSDSTESKLNAITEYIDSKVQQSYDNIMTVNSNDRNRFNTIEDRISDCESKINDQKRELGDYRTNIQHIASSIASFNDTNVTLDKNLQGTLKNSVNYVKLNLQKIYEELGRLKDIPPPPTLSKTSISDNLNALIQQQQQSLSSNRSQSSQKPSILSPHIQKPQVNQKQPIQQTPTKDHSLQQLQTKEQSLGIPKNDFDQNQPLLDSKIESKNEPKQDENQQKPQILQPQPPQETPIQTPISKPANIDNKINNPSPNVTFSTPKHTTPKPVTTTTPSSSQRSNNFIPYDLNKVRPYSEVQVHWHDRPKLPEIRPFMTIEEVVDYIYRMQPYLQSYLYAMHGKIIESWTQLQQKVDKNLVEKMFERMQEIVAEINIVLNQLKEEVKQTATRKEINSFLEDISKSTRSDGQTAVGRVRCIACGRETMQITGAMTEAEIARKFGSNTPNSLVRGVTNHKPGIAYNSMEGFDSAIVEEPRSKRPAQASLSQSQTQQVKTKGKLQ